MRLKISSYIQFSDEFLNNEQMLLIITKKLIHDFKVDSLKKSIRPINYVITTGRVNDSFVYAESAMLVKADGVRIPRIIKTMLLKRIS